MGNTICPMVVSRLARTSALIAGIAAYFFRPWSCSQALGEFSPQDNVPYADFDRHGFGIMTGWLLALLFALPVFWLVRRIISSVDGEQKIPATPLGKPVIFGSVFVAFALALPTYSQISYLLGLPAKIVSPVLVSAVAWATIVFVLWIAFICRADGASISQSLKSRSLLLAALIGLPKFLIVASWVVR